VKCPQFPYDPPTVRSLFLDTQRKEVTSTAVLAELITLFDFDFHSQSDAEDYSCKDPTPRSSAVILSKKPGVHFPVLIAILVQIGRPGNDRLHFRRLQVAFMQNTLLRPISADSTKSFRLL
jgi:hypothetical protein